ncbi:hypothetical protein AAHA92_12508 [Salvia divinorum]|uniref:Uncharacterized protein n=1 Tax=Salvia divinorum TaxID=28513 RepID=A0ABD1HPL5_SALDI
MSCNSGRVSGRESNLGSSLARQGIDVGTAATPLPAAPMSPSSSNAMRGDIGGTWKSNNLSNTTCPLRFRFRLLCFGAS